MAALLLGRGLDLKGDDRAVADDTPESEWVCQLAHLLADRLGLDTPSIEARLTEDGVLTQRYAAMTRRLKSRQGRRRRLQRSTRSLKNAVVLVPSRRSPVNGGLCES